ncbi:MAG TPA: glycosyltransferase [Candidatus Acidoferrum sp.]|nr:glycosyltransferase [Candidatus Acidoferrum sp.]
MPSGRLFKRKAFLSGHYEGQDVLQEIDDLDLICLEPGPGYKFKEKWQRRLLFRDFSRRLIYQNPGLKKVRLTQEYDLFLAMCQYTHDFVHINAIEAWKERCKVSACWIDELWLAELPQCKYWIQALRNFDHVFVSCLETVEPLSKIIGKPCHWLPGAVDALGFSPYPNSSSRVIDVYSIGRRCEAIHRELYRAADNGSIFYVHDTFEGSLSDVYDHRQHRNLVSNIAKRAKFFMVAPGKVNSPGETQGQEEIGRRYYEGAAAGTVMIGQAPNCDSFRRMFPWPNAVVPIQSDGSDVIDVIATLDRDLERVVGISQRNAVEALLRHDWMYRWKELLRVAGLAPLPKMAAREQRLKGLADRILTMASRHV